MTIISRKHRFIYLKSEKTAGTAVEAYFLTQTQLGKDIWHTATDVEKYGIQLQNNQSLIGSIAGNLLTAPNLPGATRFWPWRLRVQEHHDAASLALLLRRFWDTALRVTSVRNPWDLMVSAWQWRRDGRGGNAPPTDATFSDWAAASISGDSEWQQQTQSYDPRKLMHPYLFINDKLIVDVLIRQECINDGLTELANRLNMHLPQMNIREKQSNRDSDYRMYYDDQLAESIGAYFEDIVSLCSYQFDQR